MLSVNKNSSWQKEDTKVTLAYMNGDHTKSLKNWPSLNLQIVSFTTWTVLHLLHSTKPDLMLTVPGSLGIFIFQSSSFRAKSMLWILQLYWKSPVNIFPSFTEYSPLITHSEIPLISILIWCIEYTIQIYTEVQGSQFCFLY